ncbi:helix-turn-helix transcriptional regulator [Bradyrhizobium sp. USDA 223]|uniref:helix-turn-helix transcriptional regulator n=1 Tax=Bradyrhizobium sp. USDA 223 TaxID=3156306 RepID=UPI0038365D2A
MRHAALPFNLPPRMLSREAAAAYVNVSPNTFDGMVAEGRMPSARKLSERRISWDRMELDAYIERLARVDDDGAAEVDTTWSR